jgi:hypothetical protein
MGTQQAVPYLDRLQRIVAVGRLKWIEGAKHGAMDDAVWLLFDRPRPRGSAAIQFYGRLDTRAASTTAAREGEGLLRDLEL